MGRLLRWKPPNADARSLGWKPYVRNDRFQSHSIEPPSIPSQRDRPLHARRANVDGHDESVSDRAPIRDPSLQSNDFGRFLAGGPMSMEMRDMWSDGFARPGNEFRFSAGAPAFRFPPSMNPNAAEFRLRPLMNPNAPVFRF